jgi:hypothetical protein
MFAPFWQKMTLVLRGAVDGAVDGIGAAMMSVDIVVDLEIKNYVAVFIFFIFCDHWTRNPCI